MNTSSNLDNEFNGIVNAAWKNDLETVKTMVTDGFNLATTNQYGESVLGETICYLLVFFEGQGNTAGVFVVIGALTVIGIVAYYAVALAEHRVLHYLPSAERRSA